MGHKIKIDLNYISLKECYQNWFFPVFIILYLFSSLLFPFLFFQSDTFTFLELIVVLPGSYLLIYFISTLPYLLRWLRTPLWIEFKEDGILYQPRDFWRGIKPRFYGKEALEIPKGKPRFVSMENVKELVVNEKFIDAKIYISTDNLLRSVYYFVTHRDQIFFQIDLYPEIAEWYRLNAPEEEKLLFIHVKNSRTNTRDIYGTA